LHVVPLTEAERPRAHELACTAIALVRAHLGIPRGALLEAWSQVAVAPTENRLARALFKLTLDACEFDDGSAVDPVDLRREVFARAAALRSGGQGDFQREALLREIASSRAVDVHALEEALYADLPSAHVLRRAALPTADGLLADFDLAQHQAVLLRAVRMQARVQNATPAGYRTLFRKLKFHRLLYTVTKLERGAGYAIDIDGPFSLFEQTTKYGLKFALALPAITACDRWAVSAELRWGRDRRPARYQRRGGTTAPADESTSTGAALPDDVAALLGELQKQSSAWVASLADAVLDLPGLGVCVPDLQFIHREHHQRVYLEVLGFWSRDAVWKRVEMANKGLPERIVFAVSKALRVSAEVLGDDSSAALYVYSRTMNARAIIEHVEAVASRKLA
jgi:predicted nuclease of restriction endonuclease-like RecB superfamily